MRHLHLVEGQTQACCVPCAALDFFSQSPFDILDVLFKLILIQVVDVTRVQKGPCHEFFKVVTLNLGQGRTHEPSSEIALKVRDGGAATGEQQRALLA